MTDDALTRGLALEAFETLVAAGHSATLTATDVGDTIAWAVTGSHGDGVAAIEALVAPLGLEVAAGVRTRTFALYRRRSRALRVFPSAA